MLNISQRLEEEKDGEILDLPFYWFDAQIVAIVVF